MIGEFEGRTAFITGAAQGIGLGIARALAAESVRLAIVDIDVDALQRTERELARHTEVFARTLDVCDREGFAQVAGQAEERFGPVSLVFNNAGVAGACAPDEMDFALWDRTIDVNLGGVINGVQTFVPRMIHRGLDGHIVNTASVAGLFPLPNLAPYCAAKSAVVGLSEALRIDLAPFGIGVSVLCPGPVDTNLVSREQVVRQGETPEGRTGQVLAQIGTLLRNGASPDAVGAWVVSAIKRDDPYILTDARPREEIKLREDALLAAVPMPGGVCR